MEHLDRHYLVGWVITGVEVVHVRNNPAGIGPGLNVVSENNFLVFTQWPLFRWLAPVLIESGGIVDGRLLLAHSAISGILNAIADKGFAIHTVLTGIIRPALQNVIYHQVRRVGFWHVLVITPS